MRCIMRIRSCSITLFVLLCFFCCVTEAYCSLLNTDLVYSIKPNPKVSSKPTSIKLASVSFLTNDSGVSFNGAELDAKTKCLVSGYGMQVSTCIGLGKNPGVLCPYNDATQGVEYADNCCDVTYNHLIDDNCEDNSRLSSSYCLRSTGSSNDAVRYYRCECSEIAYPYMKDEDCPAGYQIDYNPANMCSANGEKRYSTCIPKTYKDCSKEGIVNGSRGGLVGSALSGYGMLADGTLVYDVCVCPSQFMYSDCETFLLDIEATCYNDGRYYYKAGNCYTGCDGNDLKDADYYYKDYALRCLYSDTVKNVEGALCSKKQTCEEMGYVYSDDECPDSSILVARCPSDVTKVWCMNANGCMHYPVGGDACHDGAEIGYCGSDNKRCSYKNEICNKNWSFGQHNGVYGGDTELCCKDGWDYIDGKCVPHDCGDVDLLYPYGDKYPIKEAAEHGAWGINVCKSGDKYYYGYKQCKGCLIGDTFENNSCSDLWVPAVDSPHKCVCKTEGLPYNNETLYTQGGAGNLGILNTCVDADATYYGYSSCYRWYTMEKENDKLTGMCLTTSCSENDFPYSSSMINTSSVKIKLNECTSEENALCENGNDEACHTCTNAGSEYVINCNYGSAEAAKKSTLYGYKICPPELPYRASGYVCYDKCSWGSSDCVRFDAVYYPNKETGNFIGTVTAVQNNEVYVMGPNIGKYTWEDALTAVSDYYPDGFEMDENIGKGKWVLLKSTQIGWHAYWWYVEKRVYSSFGEQWGSDIWLEEEIDESYAYLKGMWSTVKTLKSKQNYTVPVVSFKR